MMEIWKRKTYEEKILEKVTIYEKYHKKRKKGKLKVDWYQGKFNRKIQKIKVENRTPDRIARD
jgi:hypothetical protein